MAEEQQWPDDQVLTLAAKAICDLLDAKAFLTGSTRAVGGGLWVQRPATCKVKSYCVQNPMIVHTSQHILACKLHRALLCRSGPCSTDSHSCSLELTLAARCACRTNLFVAIFAQPLATTRVEGSAKGGVEWSVS